MLKADDPGFFEERLQSTGVARPGDSRSQYQRDRARIVHSAAFRRLQGKTQVMGVGEGDFHRTRLTHSIECAQIGNGLLDTLLKATNQVPSDLQTWLPERDLIEAACFAHDIGHPPFGHGGEKALHEKMRKAGGFEGNGQTLRILTRLEKYKSPGMGIDPTRRLVLAILKYPVPFSSFDPAKYQSKPPKCFFDEEQDVVNWACEGFSQEERTLLAKKDTDDKATSRTFDCSLMELADDIAYGIHDIEDIVARRLADKDEVAGAIDSSFAGLGPIGEGAEVVTATGVIEGLFKDSFERKQTISKLVNLFVANVEVATLEEFEHPLLRHRADLPRDHKMLLGKLKKIALDLVVRRAEVQQLERRGQLVVGKLFEALSTDPVQLIPRSSWKDASTGEGSEPRRVCDYIAGMTDSYAERVYWRLFIPGYGSSADEL